MASVNKVIIVGNLGRDPEVRYLPSGEAVCNISVATTRTWKNKENERQEETEWHRVSLFGRQAEVAGEYLKKGRPVYLEGRLKTRKYQDKDGRDTYATEIIADTMQLMGGKEDGGGSGERASSPAPAPRSSAPSPRAAAPAPASGGAQAGFDDMDDDIPFITCSAQFDMQPASERRMKRYHF